MNIVLAVAGVVLGLTLLYLAYRFLKYVFDGSVWDFDWDEYEPLVEEKWKTEPAHVIKKPSHNIEPKFSLTHEGKISVDLGSSILTMDIGGAEVFNQILSRFIKLAKLSQQPLGDNDESV